MIYFKFLFYVSGSSSRIAQCSSSPALLPWRRPVEADHLVSLGCCLCGGLFIAHSSWSLERENARNHETETSSSYFDVEWFPCSLVRGRISAPVDRRLHDRKQPHTPHKSCRTPLSVQLWVSKLSKSCQHFLNLLVKEKQLWQVNVLSPRMPLYGTLSLFRTSFVGCYAFPCVSLGCDVSTCKPNWMATLIMMLIDYINFWYRFIPEQLYMLLHWALAWFLQIERYQNGINRGGHPIALVTMVTTLCEARLFVTCKPSEVCHYWVQFWSLRFSHGGACFRANVKKMTIARASCHLIGVWIAGMDCSIRMKMW